MAAGDRPPQWIAWLLAARLRPTEVGRTILGDLNEEFIDRARRDRRAAASWYRREAASILWRRTATAPRTFNQQLAPPGDSLMIRLLTDTRHAIRGLMQQPRFTIIASLTLALGVGASTAIFTVVNGILLKPLPYAAPDRLVNVWSHAPSLGYDQFPLSPDLYYLYERDNQVFDSMALFQRRRANLVSDGAPDFVETIATTRSYFSVFGITPLQGRTFTPEEDAEGGAAVVLVSHRAWRARLGGDPAVVGRRLRINDVDTQIVGVTPATIDGTGTPDFFLPARLNQKQPPQGSFGWNAVARLKPGVTTEAAATQLVPLVQRHLDSLTNPTYRAFLSDGRYAPRVNLIKDEVVGGVERPLWILLGTVGILLMIACANVANLMLVRAEGRHLDIAVRVAMGAARSTLVRGMLVESLILALMGSAIGVGAVAVGLPALMRLAPPTLPRLHLITLDATVMIFTAGIAVLAALLFGVLPALRYTRTPSLAVLRQGNRGGHDGPARQRTRQALVIAQTALAVVLLVGSGLLARSFSRLSATDPGFDPRNVMTFRLALPAIPYPDEAAIRGFTDRLFERLSAMPGVTNVAATTALPFANAAPGTSYEFEGRPVTSGNVAPMVHYKIVAGSYFDTMGIPLRQGRQFHSGDLADNATTVLVNDALAQQYWPGDNPIGKRFRITSPNPESPSPWVTVVGLVGTERQDGFRLPVRPLIYYARADLSSADSSRILDVIVRGVGLETRAAELRQAVWSIDEGLPLASLRPMQEILDRSILELTFTMTTLGLAAGLALVLGAIGLYGVLSCAVTLRTREIGVRLALGAPPGAVLRSVVVQGTVLAAIGVAVGLAGAAALTRLMSELLFETEPLDPLTFVTMAAALLVVAGVSSFLPARRAAHVSPMESMKAD
ncbi:MAG TPA: ABC transporter permease [Vicinamibacterales bacterium]|nr:ABC transporter permease [Vicinamibacterales bacterium]